MNSSYQPFYQSTQTPVYDLTATNAAALASNSTQEPVAMTPSMIEYPHHHTYQLDESGTLDSMDHFISQPHRFSPMDESSLFLTKSINAHATYLQPSPPDTSILTAPHTTTTTMHSLSAWRPQHHHHYHHEHETIEEGREYHAERINEDAEEEMWESTVGEKMDNQPMSLVENPSQLLKEDAIVSPLLWSAAQQSYPNSPFLHSPQFDRPFSPTQQPDLDQQLNESMMYQQEMQPHQHQHQPQQSNYINYQTTDSSSAASSVNMEQVSPHEIYPNSCMNPYTAPQQLPPMPHSSKPHEKPVARAPPLSSKKKKLSRTEHVKQACIPCRRLKTSCDDERPCRRCAKVGRECTDRSPEEIEAARIRRMRVSAAVKQKSNSAGSSSSPPIKHKGKRSLGEVAKAPATSPTAASNSPKISPTPNPSAIGISANSVSATDAISIQLYSRSFLAVLLQSGIRDDILNAQKQLEDAKADVCAMVEFHTQVDCVCLHLSDQLIVEDFQFWLLDGLTPEQLNSPTWLSSPIAPWSNLKTRPLHYAFQPNIHHLLSEYDPNTASAFAAPLGLALTAEEQSYATFVIEWLPSANVSFQKYRQLLINKLYFDQQCRQIRETMLTTGNVMNLHDMRLPDLNHMTLEQFPSYNFAPPDVETQAEIEKLARGFSMLGIGRALSAKPPLPTEYDRVHFVHASWCACKDVKLDYDTKETEPEQTQTESGKRQRYIDGSSSASPTSSAGSPTSTAVPISTPIAPFTPECLCSHSLPLPARLHVNQGFERYFGWKSSEVENGMRTEGFRWSRRWYPPSMWPHSQASQSHQAKVTLQLVVAKLLERLSGRPLPPAVDTGMTQQIYFAAAASSVYGACTDGPPTSLARSQIVESIVQSASFMTKQGEIVPASTKSFRVQVSDGEHKPSAVTISWIIPEEMLASK